MNLQGHFFYHPTTLKHLLKDSSQGLRELSYFFFDFDELYTPALKASQCIKQTTPLQSLSISKLLQMNSQLSKRQRQQKWEWLTITKCDQSEEFVFDTTLQFIPEKLRIRIDSTWEWDLKITTDSPSQPSKYFKSSSPKILVGFSINNLESKRRKNKADNIMKTYCVNERVYLHFKTKFPFFEFHDLLGRHIAEKNIWFDLTFKTHAQRVTQAIDIIDWYHLQLKDTEEFKDEQQSNALLKQNDTQGTRSFFIWKPRIKILQTPTSTSRSKIIETQMAR